MVYVQYGCGFSVAEGWLNFDASPTLWIERLPLIGRTMSAALSGNSEQFPLSVRFGNICKGPLVPARTAQGVYASHVLEHLSLSDFRRALLHTRAMLEPGGVFRLVVPDLLGRAQRYVSEAGGQGFTATDFVRSTYLGTEHRSAGVIGTLRKAMGNSIHLWMWDERSMAAELRIAGFIQIRRCEKGDSGIPMFDAIEDENQFYNAEVDVSECAMEARV